MRVYVRLWPALFALGTACGGSSGPTSGNSNNPPPSGASVETVSMMDFAFSPATKTIKVGTVVKWVNDGKTAHTATSDGGAFDSGTLAASGTTMDAYGGTTTTPGGSFSMTFSTPGTYAYHCTFHGTLNNMKGTITVTQ